MTDTLARYKCPSCEGSGYVDAAGPDDVTNCVDCLGHGYDHAAIAAHIEAIEAENAALRADAELGAAVRWLSDRDILIDQWEGSIDLPAGARHKRPAAIRIGDSLPEAIISACKAAGWG